MSESRPQAPPSSADASGPSPTVSPEAATARGGETPVPPTPAPLPSIPGFEVLEEIGRGGMGIVYKARQLSLDRVVALKMVRDGTLATPDQLKRFHTEASAVARLVHPNIVQIYDLRELNGVPFFPMEYVSGGSLAQLLTRQPLSPRDAAELIETLARAVHYAHSQGIVHRDLKPANVLLAADPGSHDPAGRERERPGPPAIFVPKISDFGLAKRLDSSTSTGATTTGAVMGTPSYMAPEQATGKSADITPATDVYALGAILYECLIGRPPFEGDTLMHTLDQVRFQEPMAPSRVRPDVPPDLEAVCLRCLQKEPARRYPSAAALAEDLQRFLAGKPLAVVHTPEDEVVRIPGYEIWEELARGGLWIVYKARDLRHKRLVALKRIRPGSPLGPEHLARLRATVEVALVLDHPNIAALYEVGGSSHQLFLALEYVEGSGLHHLASGRSLAPAEAAAVVELLARAAHHAHDKGLVHCHLQMANVLMARREPAPDDPDRPGLLQHHAPKIIGFEMAQKRDDRAGGRDSLTTVRPTSYAMAPEQLFSRHDEIGPATDVYALGVLLYELLTGQPPYRAATTSDLLLKVGFEVLQPPDRVNLDVPAGVDAVCMKCLERAPADRYAGALELADDLARFRRGERTLAQGQPFWDRVKGWFAALLGRRRRGTGPQGGRHGPPTP